MIDFTEEELGELDSRWEAYEAAPDAAANINQLKSWVRACWEFPQHALKNVIPN